MYQALSTIEFAATWVFLLLPLPLFARWLLPPAQPNTAGALRVPFYQRLGAQSAQSKSLSNRAILFLAIFAWILLVIATARPQFVGDSIRQVVNGRSLMLAIDLSRSMNEPDMIINRKRTTRLQAVKAVAGDFIKMREGDRIGLILFGSKAYLQSPLTFDRKTVATLLIESFIELAGNETAIGDAIGLAIKRLQNQSESNRVLILLTDGANSAGNVNPLKAADLAAQEQVTIYTIGVGSRRSHSLNEKGLKAIAEKTGGQFFRATDVASLAEIYKKLDEIEPISEDELSYRPVQELFYYPLMLAFLLAMLIALLKSELCHQLLSNCRTKVSDKSAEMQKEGL